MAISYFNETFVLGKDHVMSNLRTRRIRDKILVTTDQGSWIALDEKEHKKLIGGSIDDSLFRELESKGIIITSRNLGKIISNYYDRTSFLRNGTPLHILIPTLRCNLKCVYCHSAAKDADKKEYDMDHITVDKTLDYIFQTPNKKITLEFQGGEPLLAFETVKYIVEKANELNKKYKKHINFALVTNLTLMTEEILEFIIQENIGVTTSIDGHMHIHNHNRKYETGGDTYDDVKKWFQHLKEKGVHVGALMVTTKESLKYHKEIIDEYVKLGVTRIQIKYINKIGFAERCWEQIGYDVDEFIEFWQKSVDYLIELNKNGVRLKSRYVALILKKILTTTDPSFLDLRSPCGAVCGQQAYNFNGDIYCCDEGRSNEMFKMGSVCKDCYKDVVCSDKSQAIIKASINDTHICDDCAYKPWCGLCPVIAYAEQGNIIPKIPKFSKCKISKAQFDYVLEKLIFYPDVRKIFFDWLTDWQQLTDCHTHVI
ncbi:His-Xaa-Ser system radical SAM maturase HxsB [Nanoarchaeota archaeon]